ncbi:MAG TPA: CHAD domain-containing protein [Solirubrobacteraceae bacterium]
MALGVGVALARAERERRAARERAARERRFAPLAQEQLGESLQRIALGQLDIAIEALGQDATGDSQEQRVHEARKALKRLRALMRLLRDELGEQVFERESALLRDTGSELAQARDAAVLLNTLDRLIAHDRGKLATRGGVVRLRARLEHDRERAAERALTDSARGSEALADLRAMRVRASTWQLGGRGGTEVELSLERIYSDGRKRMRKAIRSKGDRKRTRTFHKWRKRVKDLRYAAEMLDRSHVDGARRKQRGKPAEREFAKRIAKRADDLGEVLGEEHDLAVLGERVRAEAKSRRGTAKVGRKTRRLLLARIAKRRRKLRKRALREGKKLYERTPKRFVRRMRKAAALRATGDKR